jgi:hypothetical protein
MSLHVPLSRRVRASVAHLLLVISVCCVAPLARPGTLGVNYNGLFDQLDANDLSRCEATTIRGFVDYYAFKNGVRDIYTDPSLQSLHSAHLAGYRTVVNLKFDLSNLDFPTTQAGIDSELNYLTTLLAAIYPDCDLLVVGNEPFIESKTTERDSNLVNYYTSAAQVVKAFKDTQTRKIPLYIGAFNNLWLTSWQTQATAGLIAFAYNTPWIAGIDLHIHQSSLTDIDGVFSYVNPRIRTGQKILITEFSLKDLWKQHNTDPIPTILVTQYGRPASWEVYQYLNYTISNPVTRPEWVDFLSNSSWFETNKHYLTSAWAKFIANPHFEIATYGIYQNPPATFTATTDPWIINPLFVNATVIPNPTTGYNQINYTFFDDFVALQPSAL